MCLAHTLLLQVEPCSIRLRWGTSISFEGFWCHCCSEEERLRIEDKNPNPKMPLVRYVGGTWRVGGILALSRAFGDAYMKSSLQFEGMRASSDNYSSGFGVIAEPDTYLTDITGSAPVRGHLGIYEEFCTKSLPLQQVVVVRVWLFS